MQKIEKVLDMLSQTILVNVFLQETRQYKDLYIFLPLRLMIGEIAISDPLEPWNYYYEELAKS